MHNFLSKILVVLITFLVLMGNTCFIGVFFSQPVQIFLGFLDKAHMNDVKPAITPMCSDTKLSAFEGDLFPKPSFYQSIVECLQYETLTHLDFTYVVNKVCQFMIALTVVH